MNATITTSECPKCRGPMTIARRDARWSADACKACRDLARRAAFSARRRDPKAIRLALALRGAFGDAWFGVEDAEALGMKFGRDRGRIERLLIEMGEGTFDPETLTGSPSDGVLAESKVDEHHFFRFDLPVGRKLVAALMRARGGAGTVASAAKARPRTVASSTVSTAVTGAPSIRSVRAIAAFAAHALILDRTLKEIRFAPRRHGARAMIAAPPFRAEPARDPQSWGTYTEAAARAEANELKAFDAEVEAHARWIGGLPAAHRAAARERLLRSLPSDLAPDVLKEFAHAERCAVPATTRRQTSRERRSASRERSSSASLRECVRDDEGEPPPRFLPVIPITVFVAAQDVEGALGCSRATALPSCWLSASRPSFTRGLRRRHLRRTRRKKERCARPERRPAVTHMQQTPPPLPRFLGLPGHPKPRFPREKWHAR